MLFAGFTIKICILCIHLWTAVIQVSGNEHAKRLYTDLMEDYDKLIRPVNNDSETLTVKLGLRLTQLLGVVSRTILNSDTEKKLYFQQNSSFAYHAIYYHKTCLYYRATCCKAL